MKQRCLNPNTPNYDSYGGRGITICKRWMTFVNFYEDMGPCPAGYSIERIDVNKGYYPQNCKWIPRGHQAYNTRRSNRFKICGKKIVTMSAIAKELNLSVATVIGRLRRGMSIKQVIEAGGPQVNQVTVNGMVFKDRKVLCEHFGISFRKLGYLLYYKKAPLEEALKELLGPKDV